jgi:hypothetical protein
MELLTIFKSDSAITMEQKQLIHQRFMTMADYLLCSYVGCCSFSETYSIS